MCNYFRGTDFCGHKFNVGTNFLEKVLFKLFEQSVHYARDYNQGNKLSGQLRKTALSLTHSNLKLFLETIW